ncbi:MAG TPA: hypothetical protein P5527_04810 [Kiritimatiellia bacterium]|nr:hypothetical protein [Kiritimatiellia bacterium]
MSLKIRAAHTRKQLIGWLKSEGIRFGSIADNERELLLHNDFSLRKNNSGNVLSYEIEAISVGAAVAIIVKALKALTVEHVVVWMGDAIDPLVVKLHVIDLDRILEHSAETESALTLSMTDGSGHATIVMPTREDGFLASGIGRMETLIEEIQHCCPEGCLFRS